MLFLHRLFNIRDGCSHLSNDLTFIPKALDHKGGGCCDWMYRTLKSLFYLVKKTTDIWLLIKMRKFLVGIQSCFK